MERIVKIWNGDNEPFFLIDMINVSWWGLTNDYEQFMAKYCVQNVPLSGFINVKC